MFWSKVFIFLAAMSSLYSYSQRNVPYTPPKQYILDSPYRGLKTKYQSFQYNTATNMISNSFKDIAEDKDGRIWFVGFNRGFGCIDGQHVYLYGTHNGFFNRTMNTVSDANGEIWVGGNGIGVYHMSNTYYSTLYAKAESFAGMYEDSIYDCSDAHINSLAADSLGNIWAGTAYGGIYTIRPDTVIWWHDRNSILEDDRSYSVTVDIENRVWFFNNSKLYYIENDVLYKFNAPGIDDVNLEHIGPSHHEFIMASDKAGNYYKITKNKMEKFDIQFPNGKNIECGKFQRDRKGQLYMTSGSEVYKIYGNQAIPMVEFEESPQIQQFIIDHNGGLWLATRNEGIVHVPASNIIRKSDLGFIGSVDNYSILYHKRTKEIYRGSHKSAEVVDFENLGENYIYDRYNPLFNTIDGLYFVSDNNHYFINKSGELDPELAKHYGQYIACTKYFDHYVLKDTKGKTYIQRPDRVLVPIDDNPLNEYRIVHIKDSTLYLYTRKDKYVHHYVKFENNSLDTIISHIHGDTMRIEGAYYYNDSALVVPTWGNYLSMVGPNSQYYFGQTAGTNILYNELLDDYDGYWVGGIENGINYYDKTTGAVLNFTDEKGFVGSRLGGSISTGDGSVIASSGLGVTYYKLIDPQQSVSNIEDFFKRYEVFVFSNKEGLLGQNFGKILYNPEYGSIWFINSDSDTHIILPKKAANLKPEHLRFERIQQESTASSTTIFKWIPGRAHLPPDSIYIHHKEALNFTLRSILFTNYHKQSYSFKLDKQNWSETQGSPVFRIAGLSSGSHTISFKAIAESGEESDPLSIIVVVEAPVYERAWFWILVASGIFGLGFLIFRWRTLVMRQRARQLEQTVAERTEEIELQKIEIETQHEEIKDSIEYAKRIQEAILPRQRKIDRLLPQCFILYRPKDIVAGDFYWIEEKGDHVIFAAADCTGHGVPGAMVSVVCHNALNRAVREFELVAPADILNKTRELVIETFTEASSDLEDEVKDGMDISLCSVNRKTLELKFAGANNPVYIVRNGELLEYKGDKQPIGVFEHAQPFHQEIIQLAEGDCLYTFTDGFADQFGGDKGKKFKYKPFKDMLLLNWEKDMSYQQAFIDKIFTEWKGDLEQVDDVCVLGIKF